MLGVFTCLTSVSGNSYVQCACTFEHARRLFLHASPPVHACPSHLCMPDFQMWQHNTAVVKEAVARISSLPDGVVTNSDNVDGECDGVATLANSDRDGVAVLVAAGGLDALQSSRLLQCGGFVDSEIRSGGAICSETSGEKQVVVGTVVEEPEL